MRRLLFIEPAEGRLIRHPSVMIAPERSVGKSPSCGIKKRAACMLRQFEHAASRLR
jgi:hypothetical protein